MLRIEAVEEVRVGPGRSLLRVILAAGEDAEGAELRTAGAAVAGLPATTDAEGRTVLAFPLAGEAAAPFTLTAGGEEMPLTVAPRPSDRAGDQRQRTAEEVAERLANRLREVQAARRAAEERERALAAELEKSRAQAQELQARVVAAEAEALGLRSALQRAERERDRARAEAEERQVPVGLPDDASLSDVRAELERVAGERESLWLRLTGVEAEVDEAVQRAELAQTRLMAAESEQTAQQQRLAEVTGEAATLRADLERARAEAEAAQKARAKAEKAHAAAAREVDEARAAATAEIEEAQAAAAREVEEIRAAATGEVEKARAAVAARLAELEEALRVAQEQTVELERALEAAEQGAHTPAPAPSPARPDAPPDVAPPRPPRAQPAAASDGEDQRRLIALNMALSGSSREETEAHLRERFGEDGMGEILAAVFDG